MGFIGTAKMSTNALGQLLGSEQAIEFDNSLLGMDPPGLNGVEPGTFRGQKERQETYPFALLLDLLAMLSDPDLHDLTGMPGGMVPDQQPGTLAVCLKPGTDPLQELGGDGAHRASIHKTERHQAAERISGRTLLPKNPVPGQSLWIRIMFLPHLFHQVDRIFFALPSI